MPGNLLIRSIAFLMLLGITSACDLLEPDGTNQGTLLVGPTTVDCVGAAPQQCLLVKEHEAHEWTYFYGSIAGFTHELGYTYKLLVEWHHTPDPPMDGSSRAYRLVRLLAQEPASAHLDMR